MVVNLAFQPSGQIRRGCFIVIDTPDGGGHKLRVTLNVSLRVPDGIVLASDSLSTQMEQINQKMNVDATCPQCGNRFEQKDVQTPPMVVPVSTWPYSQKMFPLDGRFGLATWGSGFVNRRSIYNHIIELSPRLPKAETGKEHLGAVTTFITDYFQGQLLAEWKKIGIDEALQPETFFPFGFQLVGFAKDANGDPVPTTTLINIGKKPVVTSQPDIGCNVSGDTSVAQLLWHNNVANYGAFSLQDAIDYARFLIKTTSEFQRFFGKTPTVGGEIDVALITSHRGFQWIAQKELYRILEKKDERL